MEDKQLTCRDCRKEFLFSAAEQQFFKIKGLANEPKRCANCRMLLRTQRNGNDVAETKEVECSGCGGPTRVPFEPNGRKPVLCNVCFHDRCANNVALSEITPAPPDQELALA